MAKASRFYSEKAYDIISDKFGEGFNGQIPMLINVKDKKDDPLSDYNKIYNLYKAYYKKNVDIVTPPQMSKDNDYRFDEESDLTGPNAESIKTI